MFATLASFVLMIFLHASHVIIFLTEMHSAQGIWVKRSQMLKVFESQTQLYM